jgi:hypothetical protein
VLATIDFDDQPLLSTGEIDHIRPDRILAHELCTVDLPRA